MRGAAQLGRPSGPNAEERLALEKNVPVRFYLDFEKPIAELEAKITELKQMSSEEGGVSISTEIETLEDKVNELLVEMYSKLTPWEKTLVARHPERPHCLDYIDALIDDFTPLAGDRYFGEDAAIVGGIGTFRGRSVMVIGNEKDGVSEELLALCQTSIHIPMYGVNTSMNVAMATAIAVYGLLARL